MPVPSPHSELELDDFNLTVNLSTAPPYNFDDEPDASMYNVRSKDEKIVFPYMILSTRSLQNMWLKYHTT